VDDLGEREGKYKHMDNIWTAGMHPKPNTHSEWRLKLASPFSSLTQLIAPKACMAARNFHGWMIDSGANCFVVPEDDPCILRKLDTSVSLRTSGNPITARWAIVQTPIGEQYGLMSAASPRLFPSCALRSFDVDYDARRSLAITKDGTELGTTIVGDFVFCTGECSLPRTPARQHLGKSAFHNECTHEPKCGKCEACRLAKMPHRGLRRVLGRLSGAGIVGKRLFADLCTPWPCTREGERTLLVLLDENSGLLWAAPLKGKLPGAVKHEISKFRCMLKKVAAKLGQPDLESWVLKTDEGGEFTALTLRDWLADVHGMQEFGVPGRHVAKAEQAVKRVAQGIRTLLYASGLPKEFWGHAARHFVHCANMEIEAWREVCKDEGRPVEVRPFGQLCQVKLYDEQFRGDKADTPARDCAFLGYAHDRTCAAHVAYRTGKGTMAVTTVDAHEGGLHFATLRGPQPAMAFRFVQRDLRVLSVPGCSDELETPPAMAPEEAARSPTVPIAGKYFQPGVSWYNEHSSCPACRGRNRAHIYSGTCRWAGLSLDLLTKLKTIVTSVSSKTRAQILLEVAKLAKGGATRETLEQRARELTVAAVAGPRGASSSTTPAAKVSVKPKAFGSCAKRSEPGEYTPAANVFDGPQKFDSFAKVSDAGASAPAAKVSARPKVSLQQFWGKLRLHVLRGLKTSLSVRKMALKHSDEDYWKALGPIALLTRKMKLAERNSDEGREALAKEAGKLVKYKCLAAPESAATIEDGGSATVSGLCMLGFMKHAEDPSKIKHKGRVVVLGNMLSTIDQYLRGTPVEPDGCGPSPWGDLSSQLAALQEGRLVDAWALIHRLELQSVDIENAYLNVPWPAHLPAHFLHIPKDVWSFFPPALQPTGVQAPLWRMQKCIYGHPASGHIFVESVLQLLRENGFRTVGRSGALLMRGSALVCVYVDDLKAAGKASDLQELWALLRTRYPNLTHHEQCSDFLGHSIRRWSEGDFDFLALSMPEYCSEIGKRYEELFGSKPRPSTVPLSERLRAYEPSEKKTPDKKVQVLIGMILWAARSCRPDVSFAASALGCRVASWTDECGAQLSRCVGYLVGTKNSELVFRWHRGDIGMPAMFADGDWTCPRSQSGFCSFLRGHTDSSILLHWGSTKQSFRAESPAASEVSAAYAALKSAAYTILGAYMRCAASHDSIPLGIDNGQVITLAKKGTSEALEFAHKAMNARIGLLKDMTMLKLVGLHKVRGEMNPANILTKPLLRLAHERECAMLGLKLRYDAAQLWRAFTAVGP